MQNSILIFNMQVFAVQLDVCFSPAVNKGQRVIQHLFKNYHFIFARSIFLSGKSPSACWGFVSNDCEMQLKHVRSNDSSEGQPWEQAHQIPSFISMVLMTLWDRDGVFYILRPHTVAFSKQSGIIRSDKRANTVHWGVKK